MARKQPPAQLWLFPGAKPDKKPDQALRGAPQEPPPPLVRAPNPVRRLETLRRIARRLLAATDAPQLADTVAVDWNPRLRSTAGRTRFAQGLVELNPRLLAFPDEDERTLRHELAHMLAWERHKRRWRRMEPHGPEWRQACVDLGIPGEPATHTLPFPIRRMARPYQYKCPACGHIMERVKPLKRPSACLSCCRAHNGGRFDRRFLFTRTA